MTSQVRAIVADSNPVFRLGLRAALEHAAGIKIAAEADNGEDAVALVRRHQPDVLLLDIRMPLPDGPATIPQLSQLTQVVMLTSVDDAHLVMEAAAAGASGCVMRGELEAGRADPGRDGRGPATADPGPPAPAERGRLAPGRPRPGAYPVRLVLSAA